jgi:dUTPase
MSSTSNMSNFPFTEDQAYLLGIVASLFNENEKPNQLTVHTMSSNEYATGLVTELVHGQAVSFAGEEENELTFVIKHEGFQNLVTELLNDGSQLPVPKESNLFFHFVRGLYEHVPADEQLEWSRYTVPKIELKIDSTFLAKLWVNIFEAIKLPFEVDSVETVVRIKHFNVVDFLAKLYDNAKEGAYDSILFREYVNMINVHPQKEPEVDDEAGNDGIAPCSIPEFLFAKTIEGAVTPRKNRATDIGYDLTCIAVDKDIGVEKGYAPGTIVRYNTGIRVQAPYGWRVAIKLRSSAGQYGYILSNLEGIGDLGYTGDYLVCLTKVIPTAPDLQLPFCITQLEFVRCQHFRAREVPASFFGATTRNALGFGSTDNAKHSVGKVQEKIQAIEAVIRQNEEKKPGTAEAELHDAEQKQAVVVATIPIEESVPAIVVKISEDEADEEEEYNDEFEQAVTSEAESVPELVASDHEMEADPYICDPSL